MRCRLSGPALPGSAEAVPLPDASVDAVLAGPATAGGEFTLPMLTGVLRVRRF